LWNTEYPQRIAHKSLAELEKYLDSLGDPMHILVLSPDNELMGWYVDFTRKDGKWFAMVLNSRIQGMGIGRKLITQAQKRNKELNGWVVDGSHDLKQNGQYYISPIEFYRKMGFEILSGVRLETKKISAVQIRWTIKN